MQTASISEGEIHIWRIDLAHPDQELSSLLSPDENDRAERIKLTSIRDHFIQARGAMRSILGEYLGVSGNLLRFGIGEKGKPYLTNPDTNMEFNLSHCQEIALLAVTKNTPVGIDLERISTKPLQLKIAKRMFAKSVYDELSAMPSTQLGAAFLRYWTELEARAKCLGNGIFSPDDEQNNTQIKHFTPEAGWIACVAISQHNMDNIDLKYHDFMN